MKKILVLIIVALVALLAWRESTRQNTIQSAVNAESSEIIEAYNKNISKIEKKAYNKGFEACLAQF